MFVAIDSREKQRKYDAYSFYKNNKHIDKAYIGTLPTGDYIFYDNPKKVEHGVVFEYKTIEDFVKSIIDNRVFNQSIDQNQQFLYHYVIIVGTDQQLDDLLSQMEFNEDNYYGAIDRLSTYTNVRQAPTQERAFKIMLNTSRKCLDGKTIFKKFPKSFGNPASRYLCYCVDDIGDETSTLIVNALKLQNLNDLMHLNKEKLIDIKGIGDKTADKILKAIKQDRIFCENDKHQTKLI